jgi:hypothetical protein
MTADYIPAEARLLLDLTVAELHSSREHALAANVAIDWDYFYNLAEWHGLRPLAFRQLKIQKPPGLGPKQFSRWWASQLQTTAGNLSKLLELERIVRSLAEVGVSAIPFKGPTLALQLFGDVTLREFDDLDLLVRVEDIPVAYASMEGLGFQLHPPLSSTSESVLIDTPGQYHRVLCRPRDGLLVELHWKSDPLVQVENFDDADWLRSLVSTQLGGFSVLTLSPEDTMLLLAIHGSKHRWACAMWLVDLTRLIQLHPKLDWTRIIKRATQLDCRLGLLVGLDLARRLLFARIPATVREQIDSEPALARLSDQLRSTLFAREFYDPSPSRRLWIALCIHRSIKLRTRLIITTLFAPSMAELAQFPLPRWIHFMYPVVRMVRLAGNRIRRLMQH